jgi:putative ABC transport system ATP-binding protein
VAKRPDLLLCDEPTGALDYATGKLVLESIIKINRDVGTTVALITHNAAIADLGDRVIHFTNGRISSINSNSQRRSLEDIQW